MKKKVTLSRKGIWIVILVFLAIILIVGIAFALYATYKIKQNSLNKAPNYSSNELYQNAQQQVSKGDYSQAENELLQAVAKDENPIYLSQLAVVEYQLKNYDNALADYQKLISEKKDISFAWNGIGNVYRDQGFKDKAVDAYKKAIAIDSQYVAAYSNLALIQVETSKNTALQTIDQGIKATDSNELRQVRLVVEAMVQ